MQAKISYWQVAIVQAILLIVIGLWNLFSAGLPPIDKTAMMEVFPLIFPVVLGSIFLFLLPLLKENQVSWVWIILLLTILMAIASARLSVYMPTRYLQMLLLLIVNVLAAVWYVFLLIKFRKQI